MVMATPSAYLETSFISYLTSRPRRDVIVRGNQKMTRQWWENCRQDYALCASQMVIAEAEQGDPKAASERLLILRPVKILATTLEALSLAEELVQSSAIPKKAVRDATHLAVAASHGIKYLLTWNCTHLANPRLRQRIDQVCQENGFRAPVICTPAQLLGS